MGTGHTVGIALTVDLDMFHMALLELLHCLLNVLHAPFLTHLLGRNVGMKAGAVPVTRNWLGLEGHLGAEFFSDTVEEPSGNPQLITD